jgi:UDP-GlcNAc:undecaprenyl-phosphate/decaprenyl-phosphate GlcNAc-1-phosphate transferase
MQPLLLLGLGAFLFSLVYTPLCRILFRKLGVFDCPDGARKNHNGPIPRVGGLVLVLSLATAYGAALLMGALLKPVATPALTLLWKVLPGAALIFVTGQIDDLISLPPGYKLAGQLIGAGWAYWAGVRVLGFAGYAAHGWLTLPLTILWLVLCTNAFNLIDGIDGLATGLGLFATLTMVVAAVLQKNLPLLAVTLPLAGFLLGFLRYNFNPAIVFLGDSGSLTIGFLLGCFGVVWSQKSATLLGMTAPLMALFVPILDVAVSIVRRFLRHQPIFQADRGHIHHQLLKRGLTPRRSVLLLYLACSLGALLSIFQTVTRAQFSGLIVVLFCAASWIGIQHLGYVEFNLAGRMLRAGTIQRLLESQIELRRFEQTLAATTTREESWHAVLDACQTFGFAGLTIRFQGETLERTLIPADEGSCWTLRVPLGERDYLNLTRRFDSEQRSFIMAPFVETLRKCLPEKLAAAKAESARALAQGAH